tara:strand:- start:101263 stop:102813 length:1551 start_codon:yes stop_codon:yes gene_type:complete
MTSLLNILHTQAAPEHVLLADGMQEYNLERLSNAVNHFSTVLKKLDVQRLAMFADNSADWVITDLACQKLGICLLPLPDYFSSEQLEHALNTCAIDTILTDQAVQLINKLPGLSLQKQLDYTSKLCFLSRAESSISTKLPDTCQKITFTSGSTGQPKGVCLSLQQQLQQAQTLAELIDIKNPLHLCLLPLSTLLENIAGVYAPLFAGGTVNIRSLHSLGFEGSRLVDPSRMLSLIADIKPDTLILIPQLLILLVQAIEQGWPAPRFKFVAVGGSKVAPDLLLKARALGIPAYEGYGLSECASVVSLNTPVADQAGSCGRVLPNSQLTVVDDELVLSGNAMLGYVDDPENWYPAKIYTGDLGYIDTEGFVHINGRRKNILISSYGRNISPEWLESELLASPLLAEAVVFGDARPYCIALLYPRTEQISDAQIARHIEQVNAKLPDYACLRGWHRLERPLAADSRFMTNNGRPRRADIANFYSAEIELLYTAETAKAVTRTHTQSIAKLSEKISDELL